MADQIQQYLPNIVDPVKRESLQLVSIKKEIPQPNKLLPKKMARSQQPQHLLPNIKDFDSISGCKMLLDEEISQKQKEIRFVGSKKEKKYRSGTQKEKMEIKLSSADNMMFKYLERNDILGELNYNIKNIVNIWQNIIFVSPTAYKFNKRKQKNKSEQTQKLINQQILDQLTSNDYFASLPISQSDLAQSKQQSNLQYLNEDEELQFQDNFQSSNIFMVLKATQKMKQKFRLQKQTEKVYLIINRLDYNTSSYGQWFYFKVKRKMNEFSFKRYNSQNLYKFIIINMTKNSCFFGKGLKISTCRKGNWKKEGTNIKYYKNNLLRNDSFKGNQTINKIQKMETYYSLEFNLDIFEGEQLYISYNEPYTYSRLGKVLNKITDCYESNKKNTIQFKRNILCTTTLNNNVEMLTFTAKEEEDETAQKKVIFIMGRTHPIQTAGSHVIEGILNSIYEKCILNQITKETNTTIRFFKNYILKIIPMINPDGVILGNSRCNFFGYDLNRRWKVNNNTNSRQIYSIKNHILLYRSRTKMLIDLHAHSKKKNVFAYGCHDSNNPFSTRQFPYLLSRLSENDFLFRQCRFTKFEKKNSEKYQQMMKKKNNKEGTARIYLYKTLKIPNVFTIENSYCSAKNSMFHYDTFSYQNIGSDIFKAIVIYFFPYFQPIKRRMTQHIPLLKMSNKLSLGNQNIEIDQEQGQEEFVQENQVFDRENIMSSLYANKQNVNFGFLTDEDASESEDENRICTKKKNDQKNPQKASKGNVEKLKYFLNKNLTSETNQQQNPFFQRKKIESELNLIKINNKISIRTNTITRNFISPQAIKNNPNPQRKFMNQYCSSKAEKSPIFQKKRIETQLIRIEKTQDAKKQVSVIEIGTLPDKSKNTKTSLKLQYKMKDKNIGSVNHFLKVMQQKGQTQYRTRVAKQQSSIKEEQVKTTLRRIIFTSTKEEPKPKKDRKFETTKHLKSLTDFNIQKAFINGFHKINFPQQLQQK